MITKIGIVAGDIWNYLDNHGKSASLDDIVNELKIERDMVLLSAGWLAREGHIVLEGESPDYTLNLKI